MSWPRRRASGTAAHRGVNVALGTDGMSSNDNHSMFEEMKLAALLARVTSLDPLALRDDTVLKMATVNGARAQGRHAGVVARRLSGGFDPRGSARTEPAALPRRKVKSDLCRQRFQCMHEYGAGNDHI